MKKPTNNKSTGSNQPAISITATLSEIRMIKRLVERLACHNETTNYVPKTVKHGWQTFSTSSVEAFVSGDIHLISGSDNINTSFIKSFLFTCINIGGGKCKLVWGSSLS
jgi:hypothetical protein